MWLFIRGANQANHLGAQMQQKPAPPAHGIKQLAFQPIFRSQTGMQKTRYTAQNTAK
jgi:hypothetical protein